jgi:hypothetical protein
LQPDDAEVQVYLGMIRLAHGEQHSGWPLYCARWRSPTWIDTLRYQAATLRDGGLRPRLRVRLWGEQRYSDVLQFCRYAPWLAALVQRAGASLSLEVLGTLLRLLQGSWSDLPVYETDGVSAPFDVHLPLMDVPCRWGNAVGTETLSYNSVTAPYLRSEGTRALACVAHVGNAAQSARDRRPLRAGIVWQGRSTHPDDRLRSIPRLMLEPLREIAGVQWFSLQKFDADALQQETLPEWMLDGVAQCVDFADTAQVVQGLDVVISIDSAVAHLAGAMGKPVWLLLPQLCDWRWGLTGAATPWYPSMRLLRQTVAGDWPAVVHTVAAQLQGMRPPACATASSTAVSPLSHAQYLDNVRLLKRARLGTGEPFYHSYFVAWIDGLGRVAQWQTWLAFQSLARLVLAAPLTLQAVTQWTNKADAPTDVAAAQIGHRFHSLFAAFSPPGCLDDPSRLVSGVDELIRSTESDYFRCRPFMASIAQWVLQAPEDSPTLDMVDAGCGLHLFCSVLTLCEDERVRV